jgi:leucyl aminopeptidase
MPTKTKKSSESANEFWGFQPFHSLLIQQLGAPASGGRRATIHVQLDKKSAAQRVNESADQVEIFLNPSAAIESESDSRLKTPMPVRVRDAVGGVVSLLERMDIAHAEFEFKLDEQALEAAILGLELALYRFKRVFKGEAPKLRFHLRNRGKVLAAAALSEATTLGLAVNLARHLVNLPPNMLNPVTYADAVQKMFARQKNLKVEVWTEERLRKENMNLLLAVGSGSATPPRLVHIQYRPPGVKKNPVAFVGKGVTFDSGGLDIKPSSGMRLMKKDMGGSAALVGVARWLSEAQPKVAMDFYLSMAENAVSSRAFRPSDVIIARNGQSIEIHNTDAEGRLVMADALDVAAKQKDTPRHVIDVSTLTGAIKVALGAGIAGLFSNDAKLAAGLNQAGQKVGDLNWIMPLFQRYRGQLNSIFADQANASDGFGGAITAALFLEKFVNGLSWAHLDIYAWKDSADGAWLEGGGSGQSVLGLTQWLSGLG